MQAADRPPVTARFSRSGPIVAPLSFAQQRMWVLHEIHSALPVYTLAYTLELRGALDIGALAAALAALAHRHPALRTRFVVQDGEPVQVIEPQAQVALPIDDLRHAPGEARRMAEAEVQAPFDLARGPLLRVRLLRLAETEHWLLITLHHIITDGWSSAILARELGACYAAARDGHPAALPPLPVQYADYALWQRDWLQGEVLAHQLAYWRRALAGLPLLQLPTDHPRPALASYRGARVVFRLDAALTLQLKALARGEGATLFMLLLAAFQVLLQRYSGQDDVAVGVPIAGRNRPELEGLIGFFVNTLVLRGDLAGAPSFRRYLAQVRERALDAYAHQDLPFEKLVEALAPKRDLARNPLFQAAFVLDLNAKAEVSLAGLQCEALPLAPSGHAKFDLDWWLREADAGLAGAVDYSTDLFERGTIEGMVRCWQTLLAGIVADPEQSIARLPLLAADQRAALLQQACAPPLAAPVAATVHALFTAQAARTPNATAAVCGHTSLTYAALDARANQLAHYLIAHGVAPDVLVGLCLHRSLDLLVGLLAILKAGGAYLPLDPSYPAARLAFMLADTAAPLLLTQHRLRPQLPATTAHVLCLDADAHTLAAYPSTAPTTPVQPHHLAYVIYTSGSTGNPKGVMIEHRSLVNYLTWFQNAFGLRAEDRVVHKTPISFDASLEELLCPLVAGASLVIAPPAAHRSVEDLLALLRARAVTVLQVVPSLLDALAEHPEFVDCDALRLILCGAEPLTAELAQRVQARSRARIVNLYGPTETTISSVYYRCPSEGTPARIPIGRPIASTTTIVLDASGEPVPPGMPGELWIGGVGVARGYVRRPELDARQFVPSPFDVVRGKYYRTGDMVRQRVDGELEFIGRFDRQIKLRGMRIEPSEAEAALAEHPGVAAAAVHPHPVASADPRLVAYVVAAASRSPQPDELRAWLQGRLPEAAIPTAYVNLSALPRTASGKIDYRALPAPTLENSVRSYEAPQDDVERKLCALWEALLGIPRVGIDDDFFALGGHSLMAARLFARLDETFGRRLPLSTLFAAPTVRALAACYRAPPPALPTRALFAITGGGARTPVFAVPGVFGDIVGFADLARALGPAQPFYALQSVGLTGEYDPLPTVEAMAKLYIAEIRSVQPQGPYVFAGACFGAVVAYEMSRQALATGDEVALLCLLDPSRRSSAAVRKKGPALSPTLHRALTAGVFVTGRFRLYRDEMRALPGKDRLRYLLRKLRGVAGTVTRRGATMATLREVDRLTVYRANSAALDRYQPAPLPRSVGMVAVFESTRGGKAAPDVLAIARTSGRRVVHRIIAAPDSGGMLSGSNAVLVARCLAEHLDLASAATAPPPAKA